MPRFCGVFGCSNKERKVKKSFFRLPAARKYIDPDLTRLRRLKWLTAIRREDLTELKMKYLWVCEDHFISGRPADYRDINNPDWVPSLNMGYEIKHLKSSLYENMSKDVNSLKEERNTINRTKQIISKASETLISQDKLKTGVNNFFPNTEELLAEPILNIYSKTDKENKAMDLILLQKKNCMKKFFNFKILLKNLQLIEKPNCLWGISPHSNVVICARWNENYECEKKVVINNTLVVRVFLKALEINLTEFMNISSIEDISHLLKKVEKYTVS